MTRLAPHPVSLLRVLPISLAFDVAARLCESNGVFMLDYGFMLSDSDHVSK